MNKTWKVAKWEVKRNLRNKSFVIGLFLTPIIFIVFFFLGNLFGGSEEEVTTVLVKDELNIYSILKETSKQMDLNLNWEQTDLDETAAIEELKEREHTAYLHLTEEGLNQGVFPVYTTDEISSSFSSQIQICSESIKAIHLGNLGLTPEQ